MAEEIGVAEDTIKRWIDGTRNPSKDGLKWTAAYFGLEPEMLMTGKPSVVWSL